MVDEATKSNSAVVETGQATFHLASTEDIPVDISNLDKAFAVNVIYFWEDPVPSLRGIRQVLQPGGTSLIAAASPATMAGFEFARPEFGFHLRDDKNLVELHKEADFSHVTVESYQETVSKPDGTPWEREYYIVVAHP